MNDFEAKRANVRTEAFIVRSSRAIGMTCAPVTISAEPGDGLVILGLPEPAERETRVRVASALASIGYSDIGARVTIVARDIDRPLDLAIALTVLGTRIEWPKEAPDIHGELGFDGSVRAVRGLYPSLGECPAIVPACQAHEVPPTCKRAIGVASLSEAIYALARLAHAEPIVTCAPRVLEVAPIEAPAGYRVPVELQAAEGARRVLLVGPPGAGKTLAARYLASLRPAPRVAIDQIFRVWSLAGIIDAHMRTPFRAPHHSVSTAGLIGGGNVPRPGEVSLAHGGTLFLDEVTEFRRDALEWLAIALRDRQVHVERSRVSVRFPAEPALVVGSASACPCGYRGSARRCVCSKLAIASHERRLARLPWDVRIELRPFSLAEVS